MTDASPALRPYVGRFAPSPSGPLHAGSIATALGSWLDARAHGGRWLVRIEDIDPPREQTGAAQAILNTLQRLGLHWDDTPLRQSAHLDRFEHALRSLEAGGQVYPCGCTRREIADSQSSGSAVGALHAERPYPGTCRAGLAPGRQARAWRLRVAPGVVQFNDRCLGSQAQEVSREVGDFVVRRADGLWAYQLAVVIDDAAQGVTDVVRGADLLGSTARQLLLTRALGLPEPRYMHLPVVLAADGHKLSKQNGALAVDDQPPLHVLGQAMTHLGKQLGFDAPQISGAPPLQNWLAQATETWARRFEILRAF